MGAEFGFHGAVSKINVQESCIKQTEKKEPGIIVPNEKSERKCVVCGKPSHLAKICWKYESNGSQPESVTSNKKSSLL